MTRAIFLGTGGYHPNERRHTLSVLLPDDGVAFDAGTGFFRAPGLLTMRTLDVFLSHAHLDHVVGLPWLLVPMLKGELERVRVHATPQALDAVRTHLLADAHFPASLDYEFDTLAPETRVADGVLTHTPLAHPGGSVGYRIDWRDRSLAYITDTTADGSYRDFIRGVDLLIHECNFADDMAEWALKTGHSHTSAVARQARDAGVGRLILTHFDPQHPEDDPIGLARAREIFPNTGLSEDLMTVEF